MSDFEELRPPYAVINVWRVHTVLTSTNAFLNLRNDGSGTLCNWVSTSGKDLNFDTEYSAHTFALAYYSKHNREYPYLARWGELGGLSQVVPQAVSKTVESQVMEF